MHSWNDESGDWQTLTSVGQIPRYRKIAYLIERFCPQGSVLDIGCGAALLWDYLSEEVDYLGIEPSAKAVELARAKYGYDAVVYSTAEGFNPGQRRWDCIVFNEMLYYSADPVGLLEKYARSGGIIIISIYQKPESLSIKARLRHWHDRRRPISNRHCTKMVHDFMMRKRWRLETDQLLAIPGGSNHWRILVVRPQAAETPNQV